MHKEIAPRPRTRFLKLKCNACGNEQVVFSAATRDVNCLACNQVLAESGASKIRLRAKIVKEFE